jgi:hypothetical protein
MRGMPYVEPCSECIRLFRAERVVHGCHCHLGRPQIWRRGNSRLANSVSNRLKKLYKYDLAEYQVKGDTYLLPGDLLSIRNRLLNSNRYKDIQLWTMMLMGVNLFLRSDEVIGIDGAQFILDLTGRILTSYATLITWL